MLHLGSVIVSSYSAKLINQCDAHNREKVRTGANGAVEGLCGRKMCLYVKNIYGLEIMENGLGIV